MSNPLHLPPPLAPDQPLPQPTEPWAGVEVAAMAQAEFHVMTATTRAVLAQLTRVWVMLYGSIRNRPAPSGEAVDEAPEPAAGDAGGAAAAFRRYTRFALITPATRPAPRGVRLEALTDPHVDFPQVWTDAVDNGVQEIIDAMDAAADSVKREVPAADVTKAKAYRAERVRRAVAPSAMSKRGFDAVIEAVAQPARLTQDVRGVVVGELVADYTDQVLTQAASLGDEWVTIWVAERDACVRCLAYQGLYVTPATGQRFPGGRTWGPRWKSVVSRPDFRGPGWREVGDDGEHEGSHPHCRCELRIVKRAHVHTLAAGLKREATRSAAKGWARPTEGDTVRAAAAKHVLASRATLPKSVVDETRRRLRKPNSFRRAVPSPTR